MADYPRGPHAVTHPVPPMLAASSGVQSGPGRVMTTEGMRPVERVSARIDESLARLGATVQDLETRLNPLQQETGLATPQPIRDEVSTLSSQLHEYADRIGSITDHIRRLTDAAEL